MQYHPDEPRAQARERVFGRMRSSGGDGRQSMLTALLAVSIFIGTGAFGFWQATSPPRVQDQIEIGIAELTDIDTYIATSLPGARAVAIANNEPAYPLPGFPLPVTLTRSELLETEDAELRELILERSAAIVYVRGLTAFDSTGAQDLGFLTSEWWLDRIVNLLTGSWHGRAEATAILAYLLAAVAATLIFARRPAAAGARAVGLSTLAGAVPGVVFMAAGVYWFGRQGGGDEFVRAISAILERFFVVPRRDYLVVTTVGAFLAAVGYLLPILERTVARGRSPEQPDTFASPQPTPAEFEAPGDPVSEPRSPGSSA